jgi:signal transduction histidine kinase
MMTGKLSESEETVASPLGERLVLSKKVPLISPNGEVEGICGISTDITHLRQTELALREAIVTLERERDNRLLNIEAITASIAHEVRQPLGAIATNGNAARRFLEMASPDLGEVRAILDRIISESGRASEVFNSISTLFQKVDQTQLPIDVNKIILEVLQSLHEELKDYGVTTHIELASELPFVGGHQGQLRLVIFNLFHNAIEAMDTTKDRDRVLQVKTNLHGRNAVIVSVEDSGPGIDPKQLNRIFDAFVTTKAHGMGLGLAICRMIVQRHGGQLSALSDGKKGSQFQFVLPIEFTDTARVK